jgi:hypothetical protein
MTTQYNNQLNIFIMNSNFKHLRDAVSKFCSCCSKQCKYSKSNKTANDALVVQAGLSNVSDVSQKERPILRC